MFVGLILQADVPRLERLCGAHAGPDRLEKLLWVVL